MNTLKCITSRALFYLLSLIFIVLLCTNLSYAQDSETSVYIEGELAAKNADYYSYDKETSTLVLNGFNTSDGDTEAVIYADGDLTVKIEGENTFSASADYGILCDGDLSIVGSGSLSLENDKTLIYSAKGIDIAEANINGEKSEDADIISNWGDFKSSNASIIMLGSIYANNNHDISIDGGVVSTKGELCSENATINSANITAGINCTENVRLLRSKINAKVGDLRKDIQCAMLEMNGGTISQVQDICVVAFDIENAKIISDTDGAILRQEAGSNNLYPAISNIKDSVINAPNAGLYFHNYLYQENIQEDGISKPVAGTVIINGSTIEVSSIYVAFEHIERRNGLVIEKDSVVKTNGFEHGWDNLVLIDGGELVVNGDLDFTDDIYGEELTILSGKLTVTGDLIHQNVGINGGEVNIAGRLVAKYGVGVIGGTTTVGNGVNANVFTFKEGSFESTSDSQAIVAETINIIGDIQAGRTQESAKSVNEYTGQKYVRLYGDHSFTDWKEAKEATCTEEGTRVKCCSLCGTIEEGTEQVIPALGHDYVDQGIALMQTCTSDGAEQYCCSRCSEYYTEVIPATGHSFDSWYVVIEPTVEIVGLQERYCMNCGAVESKAIPRLSSSGTPSGTPTDTPSGTPSSTPTDTPSGTPSDKPTDTPSDNPSGTPSDTPSDTSSGTPSGTPVVVPSDKPSDTPSDTNEPAADPVKQTGVDGTALGEGASAEAAETAIAGMKSDNDLPGSVFNKLQLKSSKQTNTSITLSWKKVSGAKTYVIYGNKCGKTNKMKKLAKSTGKNKKFTKVLGKKVKKGTYYKFMIVALDKNNNVVSSSKIIHVATKGGNVGNVGKVTTKAKNNKVSISKGKTFKLAGKQTPAVKKLTVKKHRAVTYESSNPKIATVSKKGVIKGKKKGSCYVYAYAQNGVFAKIKVTIK